MCLYSYWTQISLHVLYATRPLWESCPSLGTRLQNTLLPHPAWEVAAVNQKAFTWWFQPSMPLCPQLLSPVSPTDFCRIKFLRPESSQYLDFFLPVGCRYGFSNLLSQIKLCIRGDRSRHFCKLLSLEKGKWQRCRPEYALKYQLLVFLELGALRATLYD